MNINKRIHQIVFGLFLISLTACSTTSSEVTPTIIHNPETPTIILSTLSTQVIDTPAQIPATQTNTPTPSPPPIPNWLVPFEEIKSADPIWIDQVNLGFYREDNVPIIWNLATNTLATLTPWPTPTPRSYEPKGELVWSASGKYVLVCKENSIELHDARNQEIIGVAPIKVDYCLDWQSPVAWNRDGTAVAFGTLERIVYIWEVNEEMPKQVGEGFRPIWAPDNQRIMIPISNSYWIAYRNGAPAKFVSSNLIGNTESVPTWESNNIISHDRYCGQALPNCIYMTYFDANTGENILFHLYFTNRYYIEKPSGSPDGEWRVIDQSETNSRYQLWHTPTNTTYEIGNTCKEHYDFLGWNSNSSLFFMVSQPVFTEVSRFCEIPEGEYGILTLNPSTRAKTFILRDVWYAAPRKDYQAFFATLPDGEGQMQAAIFNIAGERLTPFTIISDKAFTPTLEDGDPHPWSWSPKGDRVIFVDWEGNVKLLDLEGNTKLIGEIDNLVRWPFDLKFRWSPDGEKILVGFGFSHWLLMLPNQ